MNHFTFITLNILAILLLFAAIFILLLYWVSYASWPPFIPAPFEVLPAIYQALELKDSSVMYDLGCGDARVIAQCYFKNPNVRYIGVDKNFFPIAYAKIRFAKLLKNSGIELRRESFLETDLSDATHIFLYLMPDTALKITEKLKKELKTGTRVVSLDFALNKEPQQIIDLHRPYNVLAQKIYVYTF